MSDIRLDLSWKESTFIRIAIADCIQQHYEKMQNHQLSDDEQAELGNDCALYECILTYLDNCLDKYQHEKS